MLWFEALPSPAHADAGRIQRDVERVAAAVHAGVDRVLVPEVLDGDHATVDNVGFAAAVARRTGHPVGAAVCIAPLDARGLRERAAAAARAGVSSLLLVGPSHRGQRLAGPDVEEAIHLLRARHALGVVTIPSRRRWRVDEPHRLLRKQRAGASHAVSQILFDAEDALRLRRAYVAALAPSERPLPVVYSLTPVRRARDLDFLHRLGVHVPHALERSLRHATSQGRPALAQEAALRVAGRLAQAHQEESLGPLGFCVSHVMVGNVEAGIDLAARLHDDLVQTVQARSFASGPVPAGATKAAVGGT